MGFQELKEIQTSSRRGQGVRSGARGGLGGWEQLAGKMGLHELKEIQFSFRRGH